jgi:hypothetical protein
MALEVLLSTGLANSPSGRTYEYLDPIALFSLRVEIL